ncbi:hypothetical protein M2202_009857 [Bradyrhizobium japonicum]|jgi:hypothetical protein|uniref:Uncharacterized protein n=1 Tax=Bradyrhizobium japonicum TaxID=375 RepID=A0ABV2RGC5_BRAJP|nr:hypothetical protein [Bradyrhizobium japonicum]MCP1794364.1 hypothetical protein [Bradyrhizobium japonicum]MCP1811367.1 hypothetical protein [Bradyrhizobium japonicum]MCP1821267.1 hypothetical protein [Bradyrhizobium japonicum]MCP1876302.1 hypothetical protein [Bradyrhizobium japonicum]
MAHDDPFTLDLFGNTDLSSSLGLGVTAFGPDPGGDDDHDDDPPPSPSVPAGPAVSSTQPSPAGSRKRGDNFYLADARGLEGTGSSAPATMSRRSGSPHRSRPSSGPRRLTSSGN